MTKRKTAKVGEPWHIVEPVEAAGLVEVCYEKRLAHGSIEIGGLVWPPGMTVGAHSLDDVPEELIEDDRFVVRAAQYACSRIIPGLRYRPLTEARYKALCETVATPKGEPEKIEDAPAPPESIETPDAGEGG